MKYTPKIESNIPMPSRSTRYLFLESMSVGDSFLLYGTRKDNAITIAGIHQRGYNKGYGFATRTVDNGVRVWRTK
ncbi:hypothetical protein [uncultured Mediterranean phage uvDeep-CGR2-KM18-C269]|nr:hypothetical protein [uncultured Mediterranean phage uvDeep-CGR2-KM18-C269]